MDCQSRLESIHTLRFQSIHILLLREWINSKRRYGSTEGVIDGPHCKYNINLLEKQNWKCYDAWHYENVIWKAASQMQATPNTATQALYTMYPSKQWMLTKIMPTLTISLYSVRVSYPSSAISLEITSRGTAKAIVRAILKCAKRCRMTKYFMWWLIHALHAGNIEKWLPVRIALKYDNQSQIRRGC